VARDYRPVSGCHAKIDESLAFHDCPAEHSMHLRTTNPIKSTLATVRHRTKITRGTASRAAGPAISLKPIESIQARRRCMNAPHLVAPGSAGKTFAGATLAGRPEEHAAAAEAA
jgi:hypothetical protein